MNNWIVDADQASAIGRKGYEVLKELYDWNEIAGKVEGIYKSILLSRVSHG